MSIFAYRQFINWHEVPDGEKKPRKVPFNARNGHNIDPHNPLNWMTHDEAAATGAPVGFVLTHADPFFFLDMDDCWTNGAWTDEATAIFNMFPGAAREISISGRGLHVMGRCDQLVLSDRRNKFGTPSRPNWLEFYTAERFIALGRGFEGDFNLEWTQPLLQLVPKRPAVDPVAMLSGPAPEYTGPQDDAELIRRMVASRGSIGAQFGTKASAKDLWTGDAANLSQIFPSPSGDVYDRSSADASLMAHLAFWTGKDAARMDRLFQMSQLMRPKYADRPAYREMTISFAISNCRKVYDVGNHAEQSNASKVVTADDLIAMYAFCADRSRPVVPVHTSDPAAGMTFENFVREMRKYEGGGQNPAKLWECRPDRKSVVGLAMRPDRCSPTFEEEGLLWINTYHPPTHTAAGGNAQVGIRLLEHLIPDPVERAWLLCFLAHKYRNPWVPGIGVMMVAHQTHGTGRGALFDELLPRIFGRRYIAKVDFSDVTGSTSQAVYNEFMVESVIVCVDETADDGNRKFSKRREAYENIKRLVDPRPRMLSVKRKYLKNSQEKTFATFIFATNHKDALAIPRDERRLGILSNGSRLPVALRDEFHAWVQSDANIAAFVKYLLSIDLSQWNPFGDPPLTAARFEMIESSLSDIDHAIEGVLTANSGLGVVYTLDQAVASIEQRQFVEGWALPLEWKAIARRKIQHCSARVGYREGKNWQLTEGQRKYAIYARNQKTAAFWKDSDRLSEEVRKNGSFGNLPGSMPP